MIYEFYKASDPIGWMQLLTPLTPETAAQPCGMPLSLGHIPLLRNPAQWPDGQTALKKALRQQVISLIEQYIPREAMIDNLSPDMVDHFYGYGDGPKGVGGVPHTDSDSMNEFKLTLLAGFPNPVKCYPEACPDDTGVSEKCGPAFSPEPGELIALNFNRHIHCGDKNRLSHHEWLEGMKDFGSPEKWLKDGNIRRLVVLDIIDLDPDWALEKIKDGRRLTREMAPAI